MIELVCGKCGKSLHVADEFAGRRAKCPKCQNPIQIPAAPDLEAAIEREPVAVARPSSPVAPAPPAPAAHPAVASADPLAALAAAAAAPPEAESESPRRFDPKRRPGKRPAPGRTGRSNHSGSNGVGLTGFIVSLVSLLIFPIASPVGLIISIVGMRREPKGFAITGLVLGILGTIEVIVLLIVFIPLFVIAMTGDSAEARARTQASLEKCRTAIKSYEKQAGGLPTEPMGKQLIAPIHDGYGHNLKYKLSDDGHFEIRPAGPDGEFNTPDDVTVTGSGEMFSPQ